MDTLSALDGRRTSGFWLRLKSLVAASLDLRRDKWGNGKINLSICIVIYNLYHSVTSSNYIVY